MLDILSGVRSSSWYKIFQLFMKFLFQLFELLRFEVWIPGLTGMEDTIDAPGKLADKYLTCLAESIMERGFLKHDIYRKSYELVVYIVLFP